jgi:hypothetical protein
LNLSALQLTKRALWRCVFACTLMLLMVSKVHTHATDTAVCSTQTKAEFHQETGNLSLRAVHDPHRVKVTTEPLLKCADRLICAEDRSIALLRRDSDGIKDALEYNARVLTTALGMWSRLETLASVRRNHAPPDSWLSNLLRPFSSLATAHLATIILTI